MPLLPLLWRMANYFLVKDMFVVSLIYDLWGFNWYQDVFDAYIYVIIAGSWKQISANFILLSWTSSYSKTVIEASIIDCKSNIRRFWTITFPY